MELRSAEVTRTGAVDKLKETDEHFLGAIRMPKFGYRLRRHAIGVFHLVIFSKSLSFAQIMLKVEHTHVPVVFIQQFSFQVDTQQYILRYVFQCLI